MVARTVLFDVTRMFMRPARSTPTGIDRVNHAYGRWLTGEPDVDVIPVCAWGGVLTPLSKSAFSRILERDQRQETAPTPAFGQLLKALEGARGAAPRPAPAPERGRVFSAIARYAPAARRTVANWRPAITPADALYLNVAHFGLEQPGLLRRLEARGVKSAVMIHDLIPIVHPEYCGPSAARWHRRRVDAVLDHASLVLTNSTSTADEVRTFSAGRRTPPIWVAPLGLESAFLNDRPAPLPVGRYFVCVGTIEPRKNLAFLLTLWRRLAERLGDETPRLVLAGRRGWENESVIDQLERSPAVLRFVHEAPGLADGELARLIGSANGLLAPSFSEGFNLPVAEAMAMGTPVIASDIAVHQELALGACLIDPVDGPGWLAAIEAAATARPEVRRANPLSWPDHFGIVKTALGW
jgi:glycosyltransferase involved in cell wall biosynthesis